MQLQKAFDTLALRHQKLKSFKKRNDIQNAEIQAIERVAVFVFLCERYLMLDHAEVCRAVTRDDLLDAYPAWSKVILDFYSHKVRCNKPVQHYEDGGGI